MTNNAGFPTERPERRSKDVLRTRSRFFPLRFMGFIHLILLSMGSQAWGQFDSATVLGTIKDPSAAAVSSATVQLLSVARGVTVTRQTDSNGNYQFDNVQPGEFTVTVMVSGFEKATTSPFVVNIGARQRVELTLQLGANSESVTVSGAATLLEADSSDRGETVKAREIVKLALLQKLKSVGFDQQVGGGELAAFRWRHFEGGIILWGVRWYCRYGISYRDLEQMMAERGVSVDQSTIYRWV